jgi:hypothetical protein
MSSYLPGSVANSVMATAILDHPLEDRAGLKVILGAFRGYLCEGLQALEALPRATR